MHIYVCIYVYIYMHVCIYVYIYVICIYNDVLRTPTELQKGSAPVSASHDAVQGFAIAL